MENNPPTNFQETQMNPQLGGVKGTTPKSKKIILLVLGVLAVIIGVLLFVLYTYNKEPIGTKYSLKIEETTVPSEDVDAIYSYYKEKDGESFDGKQTLSYIQQLYVENYIFKKELKDKGKAIGNIEAGKAKFSNIGSLNDAPPILKSLVAENAALKEVLLQEVDIKARSGYLYSIKIFDTVNATEKAQLEAFMKSRLNYFRNQITNGSQPSEIVDEFKNDTLLKTRQKLLVNAFQFESMSASHPFMNGDDFLDKVFTTGMNTVSEIFQAGNDSQVIYGFVYPTNPIPTGKYGDFRVWLEEQKKLLSVESNFSEINTNSQ